MRLDGQREAPVDTEVLVALRSGWGFSIDADPASPLASDLVDYFRFFLVDSLTVVRGLRFTVDCFTYRPVIALRPCLAMSPLLPQVDERDLSRERPKCSTS